MCRISGQRVEVDHRIEFATNTNPSVELPAQLVLIDIVVVIQWRARQRALERRQPRANDALGTDDQWLAAVFVGQHDADTMRKRG